MALMPQSVINLSKISSSEQNTLYFLRLPFSKDGYGYLIRVARVAEVSDKPPARLPLN